MTCRRFAFAGRKSLPDTSRLVPIWPGTPHKGRSVAGLRHKNVNSSQNRAIIVIKSELPDGKGVAAMTLKSIVFGAILAFGAAGANATVIDYTSAATGTSGSIFGGAINWTMTASGYLNNSQLFDGRSKPVGSGLVFDRDGYGVGAADDEITTTAMRQEWIEVAFSAPVMVNAFYFLDLFVSRTGSSREVGEATINGVVYSLDATDIAGSGAGGFAGLSINPVMASVIRFTVLSSNDNVGFADGALAGIEVAPVPLPAAGMLLLGSLGAMVALRRRRQV